MTSWATILHHAQGPVTALAVDPSGTYMATAGADSQIKVRLPD